jgi:hypothetical protein
MNNASFAARCVIRLADLVAGAERGEWIAAMAGETAAGGGTRWALGCLGAALAERLGREWRFILALALAPLLALVWSGIVFFTTVAIIRGIGLPAAIMVGFLLAAPLPFPLLLARYFPDRAWATAPIAFLTYTFIPLLWLTGLDLAGWFSSSATWFNLPAFIGFPLDVGAWVAAAWAGRAWAFREQRRT